MTQPIAPWASTPNYPAGANDWNGTPTKTAPAATYLTPLAAQGLTAQNLNYLLNQRDQILGQVAVALMAQAVANWNPPTADIGGSVVQNSPTAACWDPFNGVWYVTCANPIGAITLSTLQCSNDGVRWFGIAGGIGGVAARVPWAVAANPNNGDVVILRSDGTTSSTTRWAGGTGVPTDTVQSFLGGSDQGVLTYWDGAFWFVGATGISSSSWTGHSATSATGAGAWTDISSSLPAGWTSGTGDFLCEFLTAQTATQLVVAQCGLTVGASTSRLMKTTSGSPGTWADITPAALGGTAKQIRGLCYSVNDGLWGLLAIDAANSYLYTSPDLTTWTLVHTFTGSVATGVAVIGSAWAVLAFNSALGDGGGNRILYSTTVGPLQANSTWSFGGYSEQASGQASTPATNQGGLLLSNGSQLLRVEILRPFLGAILGATKLGGGMVASSQIAGFAGNVPIVGPSVQNFSPPTIRLTHATSPVGTPWHQEMYSEAQFLLDVSGGTVGVDVGKVSLVDGAHLSFTNIAGDFSANNVTLTDSSGRTFEDPSTPLTFASPRVLATKGESLTYMLDVVNSRWKLV